MRSKHLPEARTHILQDGDDVFAYIENMQDLRDAGVDTLEWRLHSDEDPAEELVCHTIALKDVKDGRIRIDRIHG